MRIINILALFITTALFADWKTKDNNNNYPNARISALCCSADGKIVYQAIANDDGGPAVLLKSSDMGKTWFKYTGSIPEFKDSEPGWSTMYNPDEPAEAEISSLACNADGTVVFLGLHRRGRSFPTVMKTTDGGQKWQIYSGR